MKYYTKSVCKYSLNGPGQLICTSYHGILFSIALKKKYSQNRDIMLNTIFNFVSRTNRGDGKINDKRTKIAAGVVTETTLRAQRVRKRKLHSANASFPEFSLFSLQARATPKKNIKKHCDEANPVHTATNMRHIPTIHPKSIRILCCFDSL